MAATRTEFFQELPERRCVEERVELEQAAYRKAASAPVCTTVQRSETGVVIRLKPHASVVASGLEECRKCLERLKRVREFNRRRREILDREAGRPVQVARTRNKEPESKKAPGPSRPWLTRGKARLASGRGRRAWLSVEGTSRRTADLEAQYKQQDRPVPLTEIERQADFHAFVQEGRSQKQSGFLEECEFSHRDEQVRGRIAAKRAAAAIQVAVYPPDFQDPGVVRQAVFTGLLADACTWPLPDSDSESETPIADLGCIMQNGDAMRVRVANGRTYDANSCVRPRLQAKTSKGTYIQQVELRVMPTIDLKVDVILGGPWLADLSPVTLDYTNWGSRSTAGGGDSGEDSPNDVVAGLASEPSSGGEALSDDPNGTLAESSSEPEPSLHLLTSDTGSDSDGFWAECPRDTGSGSDEFGAGSSGAEGSQHLERVAALAADVRPAEFVGAVEEDSSSDPLSFFASKREANGAFALLPASVCRHAIEYHAAGKPATWHAQAAAALQQGRQLVAEGRPRVKRRQVRWSDQVAVVTSPVEREPKSQAANAAPAAPPVPVLEPRERGLLTERRNKY
ncbi:hypothetical protein CYMTET_39358 [Cymbomonas tetramitiformis]|uniref:Uncharacterized protein n=1 Tax=Cymbomonas tetramitiformis TaxID=36881 RepID=A0AAE0CBK7_9CHLO|nr:hypothetical protein CYMTET_39358 [Cymbomonas tetramitiformis]